MPVCPRCQQEVPAGDKFCPHCGYQLEVAASSSPGGPEASTPATPGAEPETIIVSDYQVKPGYYLKTGWEIFKQNIPGFVGFTVLVFLIPMVLIGLLGRFGQLIHLIISGPLSAGWFVVSAKLVQRQPTQFSDFFAGFHYFLPLLLYTIIGAVLISLGFVLLIIPGIYLFVGYTFAALLILDRRLDFWPAMESSRKTVHRQWFGFFVFILALVLLNLGGALLLGIGLLVTIPWSLCAITVAFDDIFGLKATSY
ncbi:MAG: zinc-ribbon domain-containing protein [Deltaproteobacteria bacterium]|nr:zinc-ribbon domain-containing protein [Deltaproteobacteria bacterium]MBW1953142.1 zinc-ribbon domain-containing protein [Deltaproteobacteria bacterium]MBW1987021.1 zinc-ribbon domain-containing protein [Deltaproteobacteria bacterium]MBW2134022.1 zinc-ribbon domain-containing protein [Deltaproteobacteria bacterium]